MRPRLRWWRWWNICAPTSSSCSTRNGSRPICNSLAESKFRGAIICACCGEQSICRGDLCKCHVVANSLLDRLSLARQLADLLRHRHCHVERSEESLVQFLLPALKRQSEMFR